MSVLYLLTAPPPPFEGTDAVYQDITALRLAFPGEVLTLAPGRSSTRRVPKQLYGFHKIGTIRELEARCDINHVFFSLPYPFPILSVLRKPIFYTITASLDEKNKPRHISKLARLARIIVSNERDAAILQSWGMTNHAVIPPAIDSTQITRDALPLDKSLTLLMASAPWHAMQFASKGVDALLGVAAQRPFLHLILIWRGVLEEEITQRIARFGVADRVTVINQKVKIDDYLKKAHATIVLAENGGLVKSFPHSLIESLVAGKPVLLNGAIAMSDYVSQHACGIVVDTIDVQRLSSAIDSLMRNYTQLSHNAAEIESDAFSLETMTRGYSRLYDLYKAGAIE
jgi:glycosyltransferase involved in cell wall biosynthesis